ncbi:hypothetical protein [Pseudomonas sp. PARCl1]|uniref:hypothetical protein n=1 Tax=Pseudomonas sp. PARCl1 TaxID=2853444 RepID=UPI001C767DA8|nr:hypothetical protein [Pseudomonas sp. PARCl1]QXM18695.1 hypothetical protein [Pseudomonas phage PARCL1pr]
MACYTIYDKDRNPVGHLCGQLGDHCAECNDLGVNLCDYPVGDGKTCDRPLCNHHALLVAPELHYCTAHAAQWQAFRDAGGVKQVLENVIPFKEKPKR